MLGRIAGLGPGGTTLGPSTGSTLGPKNGATLGLGATEGRPSSPGTPGLALFARYIFVTVLIFMWEHNYLNNYEIPLIIGNPN
jgi:hypothetical protein